MRQKLKWGEIIGILLWAVSAGLLCVSVFLSFSSDIWYDELFTMGLANQSLSELVSITARDVHPPLYYLIVKLFLTISGTAEGSITVQVWVAKLVSILPFFLCLIYALTKVRKYFGMLTAGFFSFLLLAMPQLADYTVEVRMYGYALFFITAGMLHAYELAEAGKTRSIYDAEENRIIRKKSYVNWIFLTIYSLAACYTHYFACVAACMIYLYLLIVFRLDRRIKKEIKGYLISGFCCAAGYLPWMITVVTRQVGQVKNNYWIQPLSWRTLGGCVRFLFEPSFINEKINVVLAVALFLIYGMLLTGLLIRRLREKKKEENSKTRFVTGCIGILAGIVVFGFLASFLIRPIFVYRYMLPAMGVFWLAFAILVSGLKDKRYLWVPVMILLLAAGLRNYRAFYGEEMWKRVQMEEAREALSQVNADDIVVFNFDQTQAVVSYYLDNESYLWYGEPEALIREMYPQVYGLVDGEFSDEAGIAEMHKLLARHGQIWFIGSGNARDEIIKKWNEAGIKAEETASSMIERYWFNLYRIYIDDSP